MLVAAVLTAWLQYAADGQPHVRALVTQSCPSVTHDGGSTPMQQRAGMSPGFDDIVCDAAIPANVTNVRVENLRLPSPASNPRTIVVFGDTGCRMAADEQQNCGDIADWPFPKIAQTIASVHADLLVHVGDYYYRENNCPPSMTKCQNRWGDTSMSWNADWFAPGRPVFASAPLIMIRGNHEDCQRGGPAWFRYLDGADTVTPCDPKRVDGLLPWAVSFDGLRIVVADTAADPSDSKADPSRIAFYTASFRKAQTLVAGGSGDAWFVTHRPPYSNTNETRALLGLNWTFAPFTAVLAGHVHDFEAINVAGYAPLIVNGESGDDLDDAGTTAKYIGMQVIQPPPAAPGSAAPTFAKRVYTIAKPGPFGSKQYGFAVYTRTAAGWTISLRDVDGIERRSCTLSKGSVSC